MNLRYYIGKKDDGNALKELDQFKKLVDDHLCDNFANKSPMHQILADHFAEAITMLSPGGLEQNALEVIQSVLNEFEKENLNYDEVYENKKIMEDILHISLGLSSSSEEEIDKYIELIDSEEENGDSE